MAPEGKARPYKEPSSGRHEYLYQISVVSVSKSENNKEGAHRKTGH